jgi:hypothetical protein
LVFWVTPQTSDLPRPRLLVAGPVRVTGEEDAVQDLMLERHS